MNRFERGIRKGLQSMKGAAMSAAQDALCWENVYGLAAKDKPLDPDAALKISAFYRAVEIRTASMSKFPITVKDMVSRREVEQHPLKRVLQLRPNEAMTPGIYKRTVEYKRLVLGDSYVWIVRNGDGIVVENIPLPPGHCTTYKEPETGKLWYVATDPKTGQMYKLYPHEILHYKGFTTDGLHGQSLMRHAADVLRVERSRMAYENAVYENGGHPSGVLTTETDLSRLSRKTPNGPDVKYTDMIRKEWERIHTGPGNAFRVAVLDNGLKYQPIAMSNSDAQFVESKAVTVEDIARFTGVPLNKLFTGKQSYNSNEANSLEYVKDTLQPDVVQYEEEDSYKLLTTSELEKGLWLPRNMMAELRGDSASRGAWYKTMCDIGAYCVNDIMRLEDMPDVKGGDVHLASLNFVPLEDFAELSRARNLPPQEGGSNE